MKKLTLALLAHVDAGKTTLAEAILHACGAVRQPGRVDQGRAALDAAPQERARGITVFAGEACLAYGDAELNLLDTPGHVDFSPETERVLAAADAAVLVISGLDGVQAHTVNLWRLLEKKGLPVLLFVSKMDMKRRTEAALLEELQKQLSSACLPAKELLLPGEEAALLDEELLDRFLAGESLSEADGLELVLERKAFPVFFGSGLKEEGVAQLLSFAGRMAKEWGDEIAARKAFPLRGKWHAVPDEVYLSNLADEPFLARVYKISYDEKGTRLTHVRMLAGAVKPRDGIVYPDGRESEKIAQIRRYTGARFVQEDELSAGSIGVLTGLAFSSAGEMLSGVRLAEEWQSSGESFFEPVMRYSLVLPEGLAPELAMPSLKRLGEEDPSLHLKYVPSLGRIFVDLMGPVQGEILSDLIRERFGWQISLEQGRILYKETLTAPVEGVGHYEPLRHYAEVHLALLPLPRGSGIVYADADRGQTLEGDMRRLILGQLAVRRHAGVLTGSPLTDAEIVLLGGRYHIKHTEGGDFREAGWRAVRQGLMEARRKGNIRLLEPYLAFELKLPADKTGRAFSDIRARSGEAEQKESEGETAVLTGRAPLSEMQDYAAVLAAYTGGRGRLKTWADGYDICHNAEEVVREAAYIPEADRENPPDSVFCRNGGGFSVPWNEVPDYMHLPYLMNTDAGRSPSPGSLRLPPSPASGGGPGSVPSGGGQASASGGGQSRALDAELEAIMEREFGPIRRPVYGARTEHFDAVSWREPVELSGPEEYIVDGYNLIFAWEEMKKLAEKGLDYAREQLEHRLQNYAAFTGRHILLVFDGYRVAQSPGSQEARPPLKIVYTGENETADMHIERYLAERRAARRKDAPAVVSNDNLIRLSAIRQGGLRLSCEIFVQEYEEAMRRLKELTGADGKPLGAPASLPDHGKEAP